MILDPQQQHRLPDARREALRVEVHGQVDVVSSARGETGVGEARGALAVRRADVGGGDGGEGDDDGQHVDHPVLAVGQARDRGEGR